MFTPTLVKVLRFFRGCPGGVTREELLRGLPTDSTPFWVDHALEKLVSTGMLARVEERYQPLPTLAEFAEKMVELYDKLNRRNQRELLVRGLLCAVRERGYLMSLDSLLKLLEEEGFEREETKVFILEEVRRGHIGKVRVSVGSRRAGVLPPLPCLPLSDLRPADLADYGDLRDTWRERGFTVWEGDYLIANYPTELAAPAMLFLDTQGSEMKMRLREETLQAWTRFRSSDLPRP